MLISLNRFTRVINGVYDVPFARSRGLRARRLLNICNRWKDAILSQVVGGYISRSLSITNGGILHPIIRVTGTFRDKAATPS